MEARRTPDLAVYGDRYDHVAFTRDDAGVLEMRLHSDGGPLVWGAAPHTELGYAFADVAADPDNRVVIITGTGDRFLADLDASWVGVMTPERWQVIFAHGKRLLQRLLDIEVPVIGAVNGPAAIHAELAVLGDIVIASERAYFSDAPHFRFGTVPGDGVHVLWPHLLGPNRGRHFLLTGKRLTASEAMDLGVVAEVVPHEQLLARAHEIAAELATQHDVTLRYTREALVHPLRRLLLEHVPHGLALEGLGAHATWPS